MYFYIHLRKYNVAVDASTTLHISKDDSVAYTHSLNTVALYGIHRYAIVVIRKNVLRKTETGGFSIYKKYSSVQ
jgi:hypothetical protein